MTVARPTMFGSRLAPRKVGGHNQAAVALAGQRGRCCRRAVAHMCVMSFQSFEDIDRSMPPFPSFDPFASKFEAFSLASHMLGIRPSSLSGIWMIMVSQCCGFVTGHAVLKPDCVQEIAAWSICLCRAPGCHARHPLGDRQTLVAGLATTST